MKPIKRTNRRNFIKGSAAVTAISTFQIVPAYAAQVSKESKKNPEPPPSEKLNLAIIGCSNQGGGIGGGALNTGLVNCVALCDVLESRTGKLKERAPEAKVFTDFREMFDKLGDTIDACTIGVPDHAHFPISMQAMAMGKHIYVEKPMAHTFQEVELMMAAEKKYKVACQMGNQGHSGNNPLQFKSWVDAGIIKNVRKVDACMNNGRRWHPWGDVKGFPPAGDVMPEGMNWDAWIGTAPMHPYSKMYDPGNWRGWHEFGDGAFGDWGPHTLDTIHRFLNLGLPHEIRADKLEGKNDFIYPTASTIAFEFAERGPGMPAMSINWYDGVKNKPPRPPELGDRKMDNCGKIIYTDDLVFKGGTHSSTLRIIPEEKMQEMAAELPKITEKHSGHMENFLLSAMGKEKTRSSFDVAGPLTQVFTLGCIAQRLGGTLTFDPVSKQITNNKRANELLKGNPPRKGWEQYYTV